MGEQAVKRLLLTGEPVFYVNFWFSALLFEPLACTPPTTFYFEIISNLQ